MTEKDFAKMTDETILALAYELQHSAMKRLNKMYSECEITVNEGTPEEDSVTDEITFAEMKAECNRKAKKLLAKNFRWKFDEDEDLFDRLGIDLDKCFKI